MKNPKLNYLYQYVLIVLISYPLALRANESGSSALAGLIEQGMRENSKYIKSYTPELFKQKIGGWDWGFSVDSRDTCLIHYRATLSRPNNLKLWDGSNDPNQVAVGELDLNLRAIKHKDIKIEDVEYRDGRHKVLVEIETGELPVTINGKIVLLSGRSVSKDEINGSYNIEYPISQVTPAYTLGLTTSPNRLSFNFDYDKKNSFILTIKNVLRDCN